MTTESEPDPKVKRQIEEALERGRKDAMWFAITTVVLTPLALVFALFVLAITIQMVLYDPHDTLGEDGLEWIAGLTLSNAIVGYLLYRAVGSKWRSLWVKGGVLAYALMLVLSYAVPSLDPSGFVFLLLWSGLALVALTLVSQVYESDLEASDNVVALIPNAILTAYHHIGRDLWFRDRGGVDVARAIAMLKAVRDGDVGRQHRLLGSATNRGIDLRARLCQAKLLRDSGGTLRIGDAAPDSFKGL